MARASNTNARLQPNNSRNHRGAMGAGTSPPRAASPPAVPPLAAASADDEPADEFVMARVVRPIEERRVRELASAA